MTQTNDAGCAVGRRAVGRARPRPPGASYFFPFFLAAGACAGLPLAAFVPPLAPAFPAFFGAAPACALAAAMAWRAGAPAAARAFALAALLVLAGCVATFLVNVPMNEALGALPIPERREDAARIWADYSPRWQVWNQVRTALCGAGLLAVGAGIAALARPAPQAAPAA